MRNYFKGDLLTARVDKKDISDLIEKAVSTSSLSLRILQLFCELEQCGVKRLFTLLNSPFVVLNDEKLNDIEREKISYK